MKKTLFAQCLVLAVGVSAAHAGERLRLKAAPSLRLQDSSGELQRSGSRTASHFVVQYVSPITPADEELLRSQGVEAERYIPEDALLVRAAPAALALIKAGSPRVRAIAPYAAEWKISPEFWSDASASPDEEVMISLLSDSSSSEAARELAQLPGVTVERVRARDLVARAPRARLSEIAAIDAVEWVQRVPLMVSFVLPMDAASAPVPRDVTGYESGTRLMGFEAAWQRGYLGAGQIVAVADTGLDSGDPATLHGDFKESFQKGYLAGLGTESWQDSMGHGTHVCGSIVGGGQLSSGAFKGGARGARLLIEGLWSSILNNLAPGTDIAAILDPVYQDGARVHSNSWGNAANPGDYDTFAARMDEYMFNHPDLLILFAAGNSGVDANHDGRIDEGSVGSPGTAKNVLTVGASKNLLLTGGIQKAMKDLRDGDKNWGVEPIASSRLSENPQGLAAFSSRGPTSDGRIKPDIVAPGTNIVSTRSHVQGASALWGAYDDNYAYSGGTSMATPLTAGAAVVTREFLVKGRGFAEPSAALVKATLMHTATDLFPGQFGTGPAQELPTRRPNVHEGYGRVNMDAVTGLGAETQLVDDKTGVGLSESHAFQVTVGAAGTLRATLVYTDAPASASASQALVNDLDLVITGPDGKVYQKQDRINNSEMLELDSLPAGSYTVAVTGINVPQGVGGKQPYALVVSAR